jgi:hypothetical protein
MQNIKHYSTNPLPYPNKPALPRLKTNTPSSSELNDYVIKKDSYDEDLNQYNKDKKAYEEAGSKLMADFYVDVRRDELFENYSDELWEMICSKAWDDGHSEGLSSVKDKIEEYVEFVEEIIKLEAIVNLNKK